MKQEMSMQMQQEPNGTAIMPLPYRAEIGERWSFPDEDCYVIDCEQGSVAEMQCPADAEEATARFIVRAVNNHDALVAALRRLRSAAVGILNSRRVANFDETLAEVDAALSAAQDDATIHKPEYLQEECPNCGAYQVDYSGLCRACLRQWTVEREETDDGDYTRLY